MANNIIIHNTSATSSEVVQCARTYIGTPYSDFGRVKGMACDCIGLPVMVGNELGLFTGDFQSYTPTPLLRHAEAMADQRMDVIWEREGWSDGKAQWLQPVANEATPAGSVGLFWYSNRSEPQHFCIFGDHPSVSIPTMIHAHARYGRVIEASLDKFWRTRLVKVYSLPNVEG
jgi:hypothetical protein